MKTLSFGKWWASVPITQGVINIEVSNDGKYTMSQKSKQ